MNYSVIQKSQLEGSLRLDAEYYQPEYLSIKKVISDSGLRSKILKELVSRPVLTGTTPKRRICRQDGTDIKFIKTDSLRDGEIKFEFADNLPVGESRKYSEPKERDVLVTIIGASYEIVGRTARVFVDDPKMNINQNIALIRPLDTILSSYLESFLRGKYGRYQLWQQSRQTEQVNLNCREVENITIPITSISFQQKIDSLIKSSRKYKIVAAQHYSNAENLLLEELGLKDYQVEDDLVFVVKLSGVKYAERADAEYFQPKYDELIAAVKKYKGGFDELGNLVKIKKSVEPGSDAYKENGVPFVRVSNISKFELSDNNQQFISEELYNELKIHQPKKGEILLSKDATPGLAYYLNEESQKMIVSGGILRLIVDSRKVLPEYLTLVLNSVIVQKQIERDAGGSIINHWRPDQVTATIIPLLKNDKQEEIKKLVEESFNDGNSSKALLEIAKHGVETAIEKNEKEAKEWINTELVKLRIKL
ncbi:MAG: restriction endonuclease subunit S [Patescibacteria group bacterium]